MIKKLVFVVAAVFCFACSKQMYSENGYDLWLRYNAVSDLNLKKDYQKKTQHIVIVGSSEITSSIKNELETGLTKMLGQAPIFSDKLQDDCSLLIGVAGNLTNLGNTEITKEFSNLGNDGFIIKNILLKDKNCIVITANTDVAVLYGVFRFLQLIQSASDINQISITDKPKIDRRLLNHWDNLDGSIERGYAGTSLWYGKNKVSNERIKDYALANASIGINGVVINNVNASPKILNEENLARATELAGIFRPYGIMIYLSVNFSSPHELGGLSTSDPLDAMVAQWWKDKVNEIYKLIPDFGGFLVKANSEGLPGPQDFGRTHADGANMLASALAPHNGIVMWRAFVYKASNEDRILQGYKEFKPLDGKFSKNVLIQVKNGALDFQPREPFHQLFGAMQKTTLSLELQITQEYLGQSEHAVFLAPLYKEVFDSETHAKDKNATVGNVIDGSLNNDKITSVAGVANTGNSTMWCGLHFAQANWYAFGRLAWDYTLSSEQIADEWIKLTFSNDPEVVATIKKIMLPSREACVNYMTPIGLCHIMGFSHHRGPGPWVDWAGRPDWNSIYYHRADTFGIGFDRTTKGSNAVSQYFPPLDSIFNSLDSCPEKYLLYFHHVRWDHKMKSGRTLWDELCFKYSEGIDTVKLMQQYWKSLEGKIDAQRFSEVTAQLDKQLKEAYWWKNSCLLYFQTFSNMPFPEGIEKPVGTLKEYKKESYKPF
jgi:alpha-glucuronidase